jgi:hypothetical protein
MTNSGRVRSRDSSRENSLTRTLINSRQTPSLQTAPNRAYNRQDYRSNSRESLSRANNSKLRSASHERDLLTAVVSGLRGRSNSFDRTNPAKKHVSRSPSVRSFGSCGSGGSRSQFNPTEYVKSKFRKIEENEQKKQRTIHKNLSNGQTSRRSELFLWYFPIFIPCLYVFLGILRRFKQQNAHAIRLGLFSNSKRSFADFFYFFVK